MDDSSAIDPARKMFSIAMVAITALIAILWAWPKFGDGGVAWVLSAPVGVGMAYLVHLLVAPRLKRRSIWVPIGITSVLAALWFGGLLIIPIASSTDSPTGLTMALFMVMMLWPLLMAGGLIGILALKLAARIDRGKEASTVPASAPAMPVAQSSPSFISGSSPAAGPVPAYSAFTPSGISQPMMPMAASAPHHPSPDSSLTSYSSEGVRPVSSASDAFPADTRASSAAEASEEPEPAATGVPLQELSTLAEVAVSLGQDDVSSALTLDFGDDGIAVAADGVPLGSVEGIWTGLEATSATVLAAEVLRGLRSFDAPSARITIVPGPTEISTLEFRVMGRDQRFAIRSFTA